MRKNWEEKKINSHFFIMPILIEKFGYIKLSAGIFFFSIFLHNIPLFYRLNLFYAYAYSPFLQITFSSKEM